MSFECARETFHCFLPKKDRNAWRVTSRLLQSLYFLNSTVTCHYVDKNSTRTKSNQKLPSRGTPPFSFRLNCNDLAGCHCSAVGIAPASKPVKVLQKMLLVGSGLIVYPMKTLSQICYFEVTQVGSHRKHLPRENMMTWFTRASFKAWELFFVCLWIESGAIPRSSWMLNLSDTVTPLSPPPSQAWRWPQTSILGYWGATPRHGRGVFSSVSANFGWHGN